MAKLAPIHPGILLQDELDERRVTQSAFAAHIKVSSAYLNDILKGRRGLSALMAVKIGKALGTGPELWLNLQSQYELNRINQKDYNIKEIAT